MSSYTLIAMNSQAYPTSKTSKTNPLKQFKAHTNHPFQIHKPPASSSKVQPPYLISVIFTWFLLSSYLLKLFVFLYFFWFDFYLYLSIHLCFEGMKRFQINLQGLYMQSGARPIESSQLTSSQAWIQEKTNSIKFKSNWSKESKEICTKSKSNSD